MRKIFKDLMYKSGHDYDYQYDWVLKKQGQKIPEDDLIGGNQAGKIAAAQGKDDAAKAKPTFVEERKENRANVGAQVMGGGGGGGFGSGGMANTAVDKRQSSATKRRPGAQPIVRNTQAAGWAKGQLPVAMQN
jgi:hypothetical protein